jgi:hypothetical protein
LGECWAHGCGLDSSKVLAGAGRSRCGRRV